LAAKTSNDSYTEVQTETTEIESHLQYKGLIQTAANKDQYLSVISAVSQC